MPLYEYHCSKCGRNFEVLQKFSDPPLIAHEACGGAVERVLSAPAFQLKGSGWYATDYGKGGKPAAGDGAPEKKADESKPGEAKPEPAGASKSESKSDASPKSGSKPPAKQD
jgi:putative FmdB family regulatory protein